MKALFALLKVPDIPELHWSKDLAWDFAESLDQVINDDLKIRVKESPFFAVSVDESSAIDNTEYLSIQIYLLDAKCNRTCEFLCLAKINRTNAETIFHSVLESLESYAGVSKEVLAEKFIGFASDGASVMMGSSSGVSQRISQVAPYMTSTHDFGHRLALGCGKMRGNPLYSHLEGLNKTVYAVFSRSPTQCANLKTFQALTDCPLLAVLRVHDIRWLSIKGVLDNLRREYPALLLMFKDGVDSQSKFEKVFECLSDLRSVVGPVMFEALLKELDYLSKKCQESDVLFDELDLAVRETIKLIEDRFITDGPKKYSGILIQQFLDVKSSRYECSAESPLFWKSKPSPFFAPVLGQNPSFHPSSFALFGQNPSFDPSLFAPLLGQQTETVLAYAIQGSAATDVEISYDGIKITDEVTFQLLIQRLKSETTSAAKAVVEDLKVRFPCDDQGFLEAFAIFQPRYWLRMAGEELSVVEEDVKGKLEILKHRYTSQIMLPTGKMATPPINADMLSEQFDNFMTYMPGSVTMEKTGTFWVYIFAHPMAKNRISEYMKLAQIMLLIIVGSVENERTFSCMNFTKSAARNRLDAEHLNVCIRADKCRWGIEDFPYKLALGVWLDRVKRRGVNATLGGNE